MNDISDSAKIVRLFFAFDIDEDSRTKISDTVELLKKLPHGDKVNWISNKSFHVTLRFLGETPAEKVTDIIKNVATEIQSLSAFSIEPQEIIPFPPESHHAHAIVMSFRLTPELNKLVETIEQKVIQLGFAAETRGYKPHLTIGRIKSRHHPDLTKIPPPLTEKISVNEVVLYRSDKGESGSTYTPIFKFKLISPD